MILGNSHPMLLGISQQMLTVTSNDNLKAMRFYQRRSYR